MPFFISKCAVLVEKHLFFISVWFSNLVFLSQQECNGSGSGHVAKLLLVWFNVDISEYVLCHDRSEWSHGMGSNYMSIVATTVVF